MKSIKEKSEEHLNSVYAGYDDVLKKLVKEGYASGANYVLDAITDCLPKTPAFNPNEVIDIIASMIKQLKK